MGNSLALQDAQVLAACVSRAPNDIPAALGRYEAIVAPIARRYRDSALTARGAILGRGRARACVRDLAVRMVPERLLEQGIRRFIDAERPLANIAVGPGVL
jgi:2-polyprenyl-6-methoxyphenol hydroxylase-like FAD-dependent oxidoreductase